MNFQGRKIGLDQPFFLIAGPCVIESEELQLRTAERLKAITDVPVLVGVGVSNAEQAYQATRVADGVIQGASMVRRLMDGGPDAVGEYVAEVRAAIDAP